MRGKLFFWSVGAFAGGIALRNFYSVSQELLVICGMLGLLLLVVSYARSSAFCGGMGLILCFACFGIIRTALVRTDPPDAFRTMFGTTVQLAGIVAGDTDTRETSNRIPIEVYAGGTRMKLIAVVSPYAFYPVGEQVEVSGTLDAPQPFDADGGRVFAYDKFLAMNGVFAVIQHAQVRATGPPQGALVKGWGILLSLKSLVVQALQRAIPEPYASLAVGIIVGGKQGLGPSLLEDFQIAGMLQIVVLSGYNVMIVAESILRLLSRMPKTLSLLVAGVAIAGFVIAAGASSSAVRAGIMAGIALLSRATVRRYDVLRALFFSLFLMVLASPLLLVYDPGLQLSFVATLGLVLGSPLVEARLLWVPSAFVRELVATSVAAQVAVLPLILYQSGDLSLVALPANMLAMPAVPIAMALSAVAALVALVVPPLAILAGAPAFVFLWYVVEIAKMAARLPLAQVVLPAFSAWFMVIAYALIGCLVVILQKRTRAADAARVLVPQDKA